MMMIMKRNERKGMKGKEKKGSPNPIIEKKVKSRR